MVRRLISTLTSLRLTVVCLLAALVLVFVGTMAQVDLGLYAVQSKFFRSFFVYWTPRAGGVKIPVFPGGWLIGLLLLVNLIAAHLKRFKFTPKKYGILMIHAGLIFLLTGQFLTELFQVESTLRLDIGQTKNYTEAPRKNELAVVDVTDPDKDKVVAIPESVLAKGGEIRVPALPFSLRVEKYYPNSEPAGPMSGGGEKLKAGNGVGQRLLFTLSPPATGMEDEDNPTALVQIVTDRGPAGDWTVSTWLSRYGEGLMLKRDLGAMFSDEMTRPQTFTAGGRTWQIALRPVRYYKPYQIKLLEFHHDVYPGTSVARNWSSKIHLTDSSTGDNRDVEIYMNSPLRYRGETFYQSGSELGDAGTILQVVRNPASITPYVACSLVALGLLTQFLMHLAAFVRKRKPQASPAPGARTVSISAATPAPAAANGKRSRL